METFGINIAGDYEKTDISRLGLEHYLPLTNNFKNRAIEGLSKNPMFGAVQKRSDARRTKTRTARRIWPYVERCVFAVQRSR
jgi:hypothetical protein